MPKTLPWCSALLTRLSSVCVAPHVYVLLISASYLCFHFHPVCSQKIFRRFLVIKQKIGQYCDSRIEVDPTLSSGPLIQVPRPISIQEMLSKGTNIVTSNIFHVWEPCLTIRRQYCDAQDLHDPSKCRLDATFGAALNPIIAEHDALADRLGRSFANGDSE
jgi:hypothetical protein